MSGSNDENAKKLARILLLVAAFSTTTAIALAGYLFVQWSSLANLERKLLAADELQSKLLEGQDLDQAVMPHFSPEIGFVLNPYLRKSTLWGREGEAYPINWLGLRGPEIKRKPARTKRVLLVGDSILFGWELGDEDRLSEILNRRAALGKPPGTGIEFITIALPGWNVRSEVAFLERHIRLLDPDAIVWWAIPNDIEDVAGVIPPGRLAAWASTQKVDETAFSMLSNFHMSLGSLVPKIAERQASNIRLVEQFHAKHRVPLFLIGFPGLDDYPRAPEFAPHRLVIPDAIFRDARWMRTPTDGHPSPWANDQLASGLLHELARGGVIPRVGMDDEEAATGEQFEAVAPARFDGESKGVAEAANPEPPIGEGESDKVPDEFTLANRDQSVLYGVDSKARMGRTGSVILKGPRGGREVSIEIRLELPANMARYPGQSVWTVRDRFGGQTLKTIEHSTRGVEFELALPEGVYGDSIYEVSWVFDYVTCDTATRCWSAKLLEASIGS